MKKILMFTKSMDLGGTENVILQLIQNLKNEYQFCVLSNGGINLKTLDEMNVEHIEIGDITTKNPFFILKNIKKINSVIKHYNFDIIHTHHRMAAFYISLLKTDCKRIHTMHNTFYDKKNMTKMALKKSSIIACGQTVQENLINYFNFDPKKIFLIENGVSDFYIKKEINCIAKHKAEVKFCFVGRLCKQKGIDILINAWKLKKSNNCCLFIFGDGELKQEVIDFSEHSKNVHFLGYTNNPLNAISQVDYLILPSRWEGLPLTLLESMAVNTCIICSNIKPNKEIVEDGETGYLFSAENPNELALIIDRACENSLRDTTKSALSLYKNKYSIEQFINKYREIFD